MSHQRKKGGEHEKRHKWERDCIVQGVSVAAGMVTVKGNGRDGGGRET